MKFFFAKIFFIFLFAGVSNANENIKFININYIVNNSEAGKALNKIIENKSKKITSELNDMGKKIENKKITLTHKISHKLPQYKYTIYSKTRKCDTRMGSI